MRSREPFAYDGCAKQAMESRHGRNQGRLSAGERRQLAQ